MPLLVGSPDRPVGDSKPYGWVRPKLTPAQWDEVAQRYRNGETASVLAAEYGVTTVAIRQRASHQ